MDVFHVCSMIPACFAPAQSLAAARAGAVALVDADDPLRGDPDLIVRNVRRLAAEALPGAVVGLRVDTRTQTPELLDAFGDREHWVILSGWRQGDQCSAVSELKRHNRTVWLEVMERDEIEIAERSGIEFRGFVGRGSECGGRIGSDSSFFLAQCLARQDRPFLVQGGIGIHSAAACRAAGASGVILDDQLLLMTDSTLPAAWKAAVARLGCEDSLVAGEEFGCEIRIPQRADLRAACAFSKAGDDIVSNTPRHEWESRWNAEVERRLGWGDPARQVWPIGQAAGLAAGYATRFHSTGRLIRAIRESVDRAIAEAAADFPFAVGAALARSHGTEFPVVQGPMTRVSDRVEFAEQVALAGGLPLLALALMKGGEVRALLADARTTLDGTPWGVGILGFVPAEVREAQMEAIRVERPPFAVISGGNPDQASRLEGLGVATYLHAPSAALLRIFLKQGARRFVLEGSESGGHVGPLSSFLLWEQAIEVLLAEVTPAASSQVHVLFAGGVHDARSSAMVAAMCAPLAARGIRVGVLMGTAYLFTEEAVRSGAVVPGFQAEALRCANTVRLKTGLGHEIRCSATAFSEDFSRQRESLRARGLSGEEISRALDDLVLGRARVASKGLQRDNAGDLQAVDPDAQHKLGMYMIGQVGTLRNEVIRARKLHEDVTVGGARLLHSMVDGKRYKQSQKAAVPVAIVGASCMLPGAGDPQSYWRNLLDKVNAISEIPERRFDWRLYYDPDPNAPDRTYSKWGGFLDEMEFDPLRFGIPPNSLKSISISQLLALESARRAVADAGYESGEFDRENTAVIVGISSTSDLFHYYVSRATLPLLTADTDAAVAGRMPDWTEESFSGILGNVVAGRVANRLDLGGPNYTVDAACASSLAALQLAIRELETERSSMVVVGGVELDQTPYGYMAFSKTRALSPRGIAQPFDRNADGIVISEGVVTLVLKRLSDAERDGDRVYAVIRSCEGSSDGKGMGLTAPRPEGQRRALKRAYERAGVSASTIGMYEAHGTGTAVGDRAELETIASVLSSAGAAEGACVIGSAKSLIGHTKAAAGMAGILKAALALYHRTLPPHEGVNEPLEPFSTAAFPLRLLGAAEPWLAGPAPRRAGVSSFGFGGTNFHAVLEEFRGAGEEPADGADIWTHELFCFAGTDVASVAARIEAIGNLIEAHPPALLRDLAFTAASWAKQDQSGVRLAFVAANRADLVRLLQTALQCLKKPELPAPPGIHRAFESVQPEHVAWLFPGQGSQYPGMGRELAVYLPEFRRAFEQSSVRNWLLPRAVFSPADEKRFAEGLATPDVAQPAIGGVSCAFLDFADRLRLTAARVAGHSYGEYTALHAAGVFDRATLYRLSEVRGAAMARAAERADGAMAAVQLAEGEVRKLLAQRAEVTLANINTPRQTVISGRREPLAAICAELAARNVRAVMLPVGSAYHSPLMKPAAAVMREAIAACPCSLPRIPVHGNRDGRAYPRDEPSIREQISAHIEEPVNFVSQIREMYRNGTRVFLEVGPKNVLTAMTSTILEGEPHLAVAFDGHGNGMRGTLTALAALFAHGVSFNLGALFDGRHSVLLFPDASKPASRPDWIIDGGGIRRRGEEHALIGKVPLLNHASAAEQREKQKIAAAAGMAPPHPDSLAAFSAYQETMRQLIQSQEQVMLRLIGHSGPEPRAGTTPPLEPPRVAAATVPAAESVIRTASDDEVRASEQEPAGITDIISPVTRDRLGDVLVRLVAARTGYPEDMLDTEQDLESELGLDSIKRIEILAGLDARLPEEVSDRLRGKMDRLTRVKTLHAIIDHVMAECEPAESVEPAKVKLDLAPAAASEECAELNGHLRNGHHVLEPVPRFVMRAAAEPNLADTPRLSGLFLIACDRLDVAPLIWDHLARRGASPVALAPDSLLDPEELRGTIAGARAQHGAVRGIVHLAALQPRSSIGSLDRWRAETALQTKSLFEILRHSMDDFERDCSVAPIVLAATAGGGEWGRSRDSAALSVAAAGGLHGLLRTLQCEQPHVTAKIVDLDIDVAPEILALQIDAEIHPGGSCEIAYYRGSRMALRCEPRDVDQGNVMDWKLAPGSVVLVTGGARGITSRIAETLAFPGVRLILAGRSQLAGTSHEPPQEMRARLIAEARQSSPRLSLADIDRQVVESERNRIRMNRIAELRASGADVEYHAVDVADEIQFGGLIEGIYRRFGRIDAVVHGAGIIEDKLLAHKSRASFDRVFDTKADSAFLLSHFLRPEGLKWVAFFASVSGRFGNIGQCDYAAGNEVMNRMAWHLAARWPHTRVVSINWGPWSGAGMAHGQVSQLLAKRGIQSIEPEWGCRFFADELAHGFLYDVEVVAGKGLWETSEDQFVEPAAQGANT